jgi:hypothetical protein
MRGSTSWPSTGGLLPSTRLKPGRYTLAITATAAGKSSSPAKLSFTIVR